MYLVTLVVEKPLRKSPLYRVVNFLAALVGRKAATIRCVTFASQTLAMLPKKIRFFFLVVFCVCITGEWVSAQPVPPEYASSIKGLSPRKQIEVVDSIAYSMRKTDPARCIMLLKVAIRMSIVHKIDTAEIQERMNLNRQYRFDGENDSAMMQVDSSLAIARAAGLGEWEGEILSAKGVLLTRMGSYVDATEMFLKGIEKAKSIGDTATLAMLHKQWALVYFYTRDFPLAIERTQQALALYTMLNDTQSIASCTDNIGLYYSNLGLWDSAFVYQVKAMHIFEEIQDSSQLIICYNNLGSTLINIERYGEAKMYLEKALGIAGRRNSEYQVMTVTNTFAQLYKATGDEAGVQQSALHVYDIALVLKNDFYAQSSSHMLAESYYAQKDYEKSAYYYRVTDSLRQIVYDIEKTKSAEEAGKKYDAAERKQRIALLEADNKARTAQNERDRLVKFAVIGVALVLLIFSGVVVRNYYRKKRDNLLLHEKNEAIEAQKAVIEEAKEEITDSINYAKRIQGAVLPSAEKLDALFPANFVYYRPRDIISGDFYWTAEGRNGARYLAVADCTGHGVPGAMMSMLGASLLNRLIARKSVSGPGKMLDALHQELLITLNTTKDKSINDGMDIVLLMYEPDLKKITMASAERPVYYLQNNTFGSVAPDKISIGSSLPKTEPYAEHTLTVEPGLSLFLFSDGVTDQFGGPDQKKFMSKRLREMVTGSAAMSIADREQHFVKVFEEWKSGMEQTDDMTLINVVF